MKDKVTPNNRKQKSNDNVETLKKKTEKIESIDRDIEYSSKIKSILQGNVLLFNCNETGEIGKTQNSSTSTSSWNDDKYSYSTQV